MNTTTKTDTTGYSLKGFKYAKFASHETNCFEATVCYNGKPVGHAENDGQGGCTFVHLNEYGKSLPAVVAANKGHFRNATVDNLDAPHNTLDEIVDELVSKELFGKEVEKQKKRVAKMLATTVLFTKKGDKAGEYRTLAKKFPTAQQTMEVARILPSKVEGVDKVLNLLPFDEAFDLLVKFT